MLCAPWSLPSPREPARGGAFPTVNNGRFSGRVGRGFSGKSRINPNGHPRGKFPEVRDENRPGQTSPVREPN
ncbi:hypothetical protein chiPu_0011248 [Chiloscyllium punctatum]|uniref:Uncharacterized protein n=1 Tax=Chiloscyllium punctatum TaxID=137246 RepID=A0A401SQV0_CHIPU|nr:hypothetical protein [Chiloscyllium punctatum]